MTDQKPPVFIVVAGPSGSGKTAFIQTLSDSRSRGSLPPAGTGLQRECGQLAVDETLTVYLCVLPATKVAAGQLPEGTLGLVLLVSSEDPRSYAAARQLIDACGQACPVPVVVAANKQDAPHSPISTELRALLHVPEHIPVVPCVATDYGSARSVLVRLLHVITDEIDAADKALLDGEAGDSE